jgi:S-adenosylmethionine:tRNA ribosyltransferase-isomerase
MKFEEQTLDYHLPEEKIAAFPLPVRHQAKLLVFKNSQIAHHQFIEIANFIDKGSLLVFNNTKVFHARLHFYNQNGAQIEVFCLEPANNIDPAVALAASKHSEWICLVGGAKKWKSGNITFTFQHGEKEISINASLIERKEELFHIAFDWDHSEIEFADILQKAGELPLPPYMNRKANKEDESRYQTVYAKHTGSVAAPTAGLHFTDEVMELITQKGIHQEFVTLHVGAGTFKPIKTDHYKEHIMHEELIDVSINSIKNLQAHAGKIIAVGTTSLRTIESLYWMGVKVYMHPQLSFQEINIKQWEAYELMQELPAVKAFESLINWLNQNKLSRVLCKTQIMITPTYKLKVAEGLITNFHQPKSTLLLLIAAVTGNQWENIYKEALQNNYRFLSYGDSSLLMKS